MTMIQQKKYDLASVRLMTHNMWRNVNVSILNTNSTFTIRHFHVPEQVRSE